MKHENSYKSVQRYSTQQQSGRIEYAPRQLLFRYLYIASCKSNALFRVALIVFQLMMVFLLCASVVGCSAANFTLSRYTAVASALPIPQTKRKRSFLLYSSELRDDGRERVYAQLPHFFRAFEHREGEREKFWIPSWEFFTTVLQGKVWIFFPFILFFFSRKREQKSVLLNNFIVFALQN